MLYFRSEDDVQAWCERKQKTRGEVLTLDQVWALSKVWYQDRLSPGYRGRSIERVVQLFESVGLTSTFWKPGGNS